MSFEWRQLLPSLFDLVFVAFLMKLHQLKYTATISMDKTGPAQVDAISKAQN